MDILFFLAKIQHFHTFTDVTNDGNNNDFFPVCRPSYLVREEGGKNNEKKKKNKKKKENIVLSLRATATEQIGSC